MEVFWFALWALSLVLVSTVTFRFARTSNSEVKANPIDPQPPTLPPSPEVRVSQVEATPEAPTPSGVPAKVGFLRDCHRDLLASIIGRLRSTTDPLSEDLLEVRQELEALVRQVQQHDHVVNSREDLEWLTAQGQLVSREMESALVQSRAATDVFQKHFGDLRGTLEAVLEVNQQIADISERINVLAINASIEAARAGAAGRGFKVIAGHVKALAFETAESLERIDGTVREAHRLFSSIDGDIEAQGAQITQHLQRQLSAFGLLESRFKTQREHLGQLYQVVVRSSATLDSQITKLSPVVQLHEITVQELENLGRVVDSGLDLPEVLGATPTEAQAWGTEVRRFLTTAEELLALNRLLHSRGVALEDNPEIDAHQAIELF